MSASRSTVVRIVNLKRQKNQCGGARGKDPKRCAQRLSLLTAVRNKQDQK